MDYKARFYSPYLNHFTQPDTLISDRSIPQSGNRFSYALNNPIRFNDPSGHYVPLPCQLRGDCPDDSDRPLPPLPPPGGGSGDNNDDSDGPLNPVIPDGPSSGIEDIIGLDNYSPLACGPESSCDPAFMKCWHYELGYRTTQWFEIPCSDMRVNSLDSYYYDYDGSYVPVVGLGVDTAGMIVDGGAVITSVFGPGAWTISTEVELKMAGLEISWNTYLATSGQYEVVYDQYHTNLLDSQAARSNDLAEPIPVAGFTSSFVSAINNIQVIVAGIEGHPSYRITWNGLPPPIP